VFLTSKYGLHMNGYDIRLSYRKMMCWHANSGGGLDVIVKEKYEKMHCKQVSNFE